MSRVVPWLFLCSVAVAAPADDLGRAIGAWSRALAAMTAAVGGEAGDPAGMPGSRAAFEDGRQRIAEAVAEADGLHFGAAFRAAVDGRQRLATAFEVAIAEDTLAKPLADACRDRVTALVGIQAALDTQTRHRTLSTEGYQAWQMGGAYVDEAKGLLAKKQVARACRKAHLAEGQWARLVPEVYPDARPPTLLPEP